MAIAYKRLLSQSIGGKGITISSITTPGTLIHTAPAGTTPGSYDEVWLWAYNADTSNTVISVEWASDGLVRKITVPLQTGLIPIIPGLILQNGETIRVFASAANVIKIDGFINRITD